MKLIRAAIAFIAWVAACTPVLSEDTRVPTEIYGRQGDTVVLRIGDDTAGASGLLGKLARDYITEHRLHGAIAWYQESDAEAMKQLHAGNVDMAIVTEHALVDAAVDRRLVTHPSELFHSRMILVGPRTNPAKVLPGDGTAEALRKIERFGNRRVAAGGSPLFLSRDDRSAGNEKEHVLWTKAGFTPWVTHDLWYRCDHVFPPRALLDADRESLYTLTDAAIWEHSSRHLPRLRAYATSGAGLDSADTAVLRPYPAARVRAFLAYLQSERARAIVARFTD